MDAACHLTAEKIGAGVHVQADRTYDLHSGHIPTMTERDVRKERSSLRASAGIRALSPSRKDVAAAEQIWRIANSLRGSPAWLLSNASITRQWSLDLVGARYLIVVYVMAFTGVDGPCFVSQIVIRSRSQVRIRNVLLPSPWFRGTQARLGMYQLAEEREREPDLVELVRVVRGSGNASRLLNELHHLAAVMEGRAASGKNARHRYAEVKSDREHTNQLWAALDKVRTGSWHIIGISHGREREIRHDGCRWYIAAGLGTMTKSREGRPAFIGSLTYISRHAKRLKRASPVTKVKPLLDGAGYRHVANAFSSHLHRGLDFRAARREIELLDCVMEILTTRATKGHGNDEI